MIIFQIKLTARGRPSHPGYPEEGHSAINDLLDILNDLRNYDWPKNDTLGETTINIGIIEGGDSDNSLADHAGAILSFRVVDTVEEILLLVEKVVNGRADTKVLELNEPAFLTSKNLKS